ncbi:Sec-independent protein translocase subunit TatA [Leifsonia sp. A12D58]|uniref:Sec-independent protein translocase subunit TatA n=1 Tax=Leifsonia sp. A12D58 TaxID=3397674 RepID=UPI0039E106D1
MLGNALSGWHLVVIVFIVLLLFGAPKLPGLARSLGQSMKIFKSEIKSDKTEERTTTPDVAQPNQSDASQSTGSTDSTTKS